VRAQYEAQALIVNSFTLAIIVVSSHFLALTRVHLCGKKVTNLSEIMYKAKSIPVKAKFN